MYCSQCGKAAEGKFCWNCGASLAPGGATVLVDWSHEANYAELLRVPEVRETLDRHAGMARKGLTGEQFLALCDKVVPMGFSMETLASIVQPLYASWGIGTGKQRVERIDAPVGRVMVRALCSLARRGQSVRRIQQAADGCCFEAVLPSDIWTLEGDLLVTVRKQESQTEVSAATKIKGQFFDWGKSRRCLDALFEELRLEPG